MLREFKKPFLSQKLTIQTKTCRLLGLKGKEGEGSQLRKHCLYKRKGAGWGGYGEEHGVFEKLIHFLGEPIKTAYLHSSALFVH